MIPKLIKINEKIIGFLEIITKIMKSYSIGQFNDDLIFTIILHYFDY